MEAFFKSKKLKIFICIIFLLAGFMIYAAYTENSNNALSSVLSAATSPFQKASTTITQEAGGFFDKFLHADEYIEENKRLEEENAVLRQQLTEYEELKAQVESLQSIVGIKEDNPDFELEAAAVIAKDPDDLFGSFTIDKGSANGIQKDDAVITGSGLVGKVISVTNGNARVITIMNPGLYTSAYDIGVNQVGSVQGSAVLLKDGLTKFIDLPLRTQVQADDLIVTSGAGGVFPKNITIGHVLEIKEEEHGKSSYALIEPAVDFENLTRVFVVKEFNGQGVLGSADSDEE